MKPECEDCEYYEPYAIAAGQKLYRCMLIGECHHNQEVLI